MIFFGDNEGVTIFNVLVYSNLDCNEKFQLFYIIF